MGNSEKYEKVLAEEEDNELLLTQQREQESSEYPSDEELESCSGLFKGKIYTETMADLYMNQGLYEDAFEILSKLFGLDPENHSIRMKLNQAGANLLSEKAGFSFKR